MLRTPKLSAEHGVGRRRVLPIYVVTPTPLHLLALDQWVDLFMIVLCG